MPPPAHSKPENVLKRAQELIAVQQSSAALTILHEHVTSKRSRNSPITSLEPVMLQFVELCVDLRKGKLAKDGLYQYKNTAQNTNVGTIELVLRTFMDLAQAKVSDAQERVEQSHSDTELNANGKPIEDLEAIETPESLLLSTISNDQAKDRTERAVVTPWLKYLWETYRTVLEILKNNARLETIYQTTALLAFSFCQKFSRKTEFRRLCEMLRNHVQNAAKYQSQVHAINLNDPDTLQRLLDIRFQQLNVAVDLELWQEAFRSIEDIHTLLNLSKRPPKTGMMINYYEKLTRIFLVSENYLFHAASWNRYFGLLRQSSNALVAGQAAKKDTSGTAEVDLVRTASLVVLSALAIPVISTARSKGAILDVDDLRKSKSHRLASLLGITSLPNRATLLKDACQKGLMNRVKPEIRQLYHLLEVEFHPLSICKSVAPILSDLSIDAEMSQYIAPLQQVILSRLFQQLSQVYDSVSSSFVTGLVTFPHKHALDSHAVEKFVMNGCKKGDLSIRFDHARGLLSFDSDAFSSSKSSSSPNPFASSSASTLMLQARPADIVRTQLTRLAKTLFIASSCISSAGTKISSSEKTLALKRAASGAEIEHLETLARRAQIDKRKLMASDALQKKQKDEETARRILIQKRQEAETQRLAEEHRERERKRMKDEQARIRRENNEKEVNELVKKGIDVGDVDLQDLDSNQLRLLRITQLEKEKNELIKSLRITGKRLDHLERAYRKEEIQLIPKDYEAQRIRDHAAYNSWKSDLLREAERKHKEDVSLKNRLGRLLPIYDTFHKDLKERRHDEFERRRKAADREFQNAIDKRKREYKEHKQRVEQERVMAERAAQEEADRLARERVEKAALEEERKRKEVEARSRREEERRILQETVTRQRLIEEEAEAKRLARLHGQIAPRSVERSNVGPGSGFVTKSDSLSTVDVSSSRPPLPLMGTKPSWREREAAKANQTTINGSASTAPEKTTNSRGSYILPHLRNNASDNPTTRQVVSNDASRGLPGNDDDARSREQAGKMGNKLNESLSINKNTRAAITQVGEKPKTGKWVPPHLR